MKKTYSVPIIAEEEKRHEKFFLFLVIIAIPVLFIFGLMDLFRQNYITGIPDILTSIVLVILSQMYLKNKNKTNRKKYFRFLCFIIFAACFFHIGIDLDEGFTWLWLNPLAASLFFLLGKKEGLIWAVLVFSLIMLYLYLPTFNFSKVLNHDDKIRLVVSWSLIILISYSLETAKAKYHQRVILDQQKLMYEKKQLEDALDKINVLNGLLPICANCKKIRDDSGYWNQIEHYIRDHSDADFSHSICPDCAKELYPELANLDKN